MILLCLYRIETAKNLSMLGEVYNALVRFEGMHLVRFSRTLFPSEHPRCTSYPDLRTLKPNHTIYINMKIVETVAGNAVCLPKRANARPPARP